jgi:hypothetical protein
MKHIITITNETPSHYFDIETEFQSVIISNVKYSNPYDCPLLLINWLHGPFGAFFSIPISGEYASPKVEFDIIKMAKLFDEPFKGPFDRLDIKLEKEFENNSSALIFEIELT